MARGRISSAFLAGLLLTTLPDSDGTSAEPLTWHLFLTGRPGMVVKRALDGADRRLVTASCQQLFAEFTDPAGHPLSEALSEWYRTPGEALAILYFVDGDGSAQCRDKTIAAFTTPRSHVIFVCGTHFAERYARQPAGGELLIIHELLHAMGLGENPPTASQISDAVRQRCGG